MELPAYLHPAAEDIANGTPAGDQILRWYERLSRFPEDVAQNLAVLGTQHGNPRDWDMVGYMICRKHDGDEGGQA